MKSLFFVLVVIVAAAGFYACGAGVSDGTSEVTVEIGADGRSASLVSGREGFFARIIRGLDFIKPAVAVAAIPASVYTVRLTVSGPGMAPVVREEDAVGKTSVRIVVEVPNGVGRSFLVECLDSNGAVIFQGASVTDLDGAPIRLAIEMIDLLAYYVDVNSGSDTAGCGAYETPCRSITQALSLSPGNQPIYVRAGTYTESGSRGGETFPLSLKAGTTLKCIGADHSSIIMLTNHGPALKLINGAAGAVVEGCGLFGGDPAVDDMAAAMTIRNNLFFATAIVTSADSTVEGNIVTGVGGGQSEIVYGGITVWGGSPKITANTLNYNDYGITVMSGLAPVITGNTLSCNLAGDLANNTAIALNARGNYWDHVPPDPRDVSNTSGGTVDFSGAMPAANPCTVSLKIYQPKGSNTGGITFTPPGLAGSNNTVMPYPSGEVVTLAAYPVPGSSFIAWGDDCASCGVNSTCQITMDSDKTCSAEFQ